MLLEQTFDFHRKMAADGFVSLTRPDLGFNVLYLRAGLSTFKQLDRASRTAEGVLVVLVVDDIDSEYERSHRCGHGDPHVDRPRSGASATSKSRTPMASSSSQCSGWRSRPRASPANAALPMGLVIHPRHRTDSPVMVLVLSAGVKRLSVVI